MQQAIPSPEELRKRLNALSYAEVKALCERRRVPFTTVWKLRSGETEDPRLETVRAIWPDLQATKRSRRTPAAIDG